MNKNFYFYFFFIRAFVLMQRKRKRTSKVWELGIYNRSEEDGSVWCIVCKKKLCSNTNTLKKHFEIFHSNVENERQPTKHLLIEWIAGASLPFTTIENPNFITFMASVAPQFKIPSADTIQSELNDLFEVKRGKIMNEMEESQSPIHLLIDLWDSPNHKTYVGMFDI
jgi:hypothetical protein